MLVNTGKVRLVWQINYATKYKVSKDGRCFNTETGRELKRTVVNYTVGFCIQGKFTSLIRLRESLEKIEQQSCPF